MKQGLEEMLKYLKRRKEYWQWFQPFQWNLMFQSSYCNFQINQGGNQDWERGSSWKGDKQMSFTLRKFPFEGHFPSGAVGLAPFKCCLLSHLSTPSLILLSQAPSVGWQLWVLKLVLPPGIPANGRSPNSIWPRIQLHPQKCIFARSFSLHFAR